MKFYDLRMNDIGVDMREHSNGEWAKRTEAEQAAKDAVEMAGLAQRKLLSQLTERYPGKKMGEILKICKHEPDFLKAQAILDKYEGG